MTAQINYRKEQSELKLEGALNSDTINSLWAIKDLVSDVGVINVSNVSRVDSSGLALLVHYCITSDLKLIGLSPQLTTLISLYDLESILT